MRVIHRRTTALGVALFATLVAAAALAVPGGATPGAGVPRLLFPVVGPVAYHDDFGEPRAKWAHPGNDLMAPRRAIAIAAEAGKIRFWTTSATAGCMLYLYGKSGTTYQYIHLNNDLTDGNDNRGKCVAGTSYAPGLKDGAAVQAGQAVGFVGDSGDANGIHPHLHFEVHPHDGGPVDPYPFLRRAVHVLFAADASKDVSVTAEATVAAVQDDRVWLTVTKLTVFPQAQKLTKLGRQLVLTVPTTTEVDLGAGSVSTATPDVMQGLVGKSVVVLTTPTPGTLDAAMARPGVLSASRIALTAKLKKP